MPKASITVPGPAAFASLSTEVVVSFGETFTVNPGTILIDGGLSGIYLAPGINGQIVVLKNLAGASGSMINPAGSDTIDGGGAITLSNAYDSVTLQFYSGNWNKIAAYP